MPNKRRLITSKICFGSEKAGLLDHFYNKCALDGSIVTISAIRTELYFLINSLGFKATSSVLLISRYILRLGQAAQKQQRPRCPNPKMYLEIRKADERLFIEYGCNNFKRNIRIFRTFLVQNAYFQSGKK